MNIVDYRSSGGPCPARFMDALVTRNGYGMVTQTADAGGCKGDVLVSRLLLGDVLLVDFHVQDRLSCGFEVESLFGIRCSVGVLVAWIERWADRQAFHDCSLCVLRKIVSDLQVVCMHDKIG